MKYKLLLLLVSKKEFLNFSTYCLSYRKYFCRWGQAWRAHKCTYVHMFIYTHMNASKYVGMFIY